MASLKDSGMGIGDFAQGLLEQSISNPQPVSKRKVQGNVPDIEDVKVLKEDVEAVLSNSFGIDSAPKPKKIVEDKEKIIKEQIRVKLNEIKSLLNELHMGAGTTHSGSLGVGTQTSLSVTKAYDRSHQKPKRRARVRRKV